MTVGVEVSGQILLVNLGLITRFDIGLGFLFEG
jgi:hypothetical protein